DSEAAVIAECRRTDPPADVDGGMAPGHVESVDEPCIALDPDDAFGAVVPHRPLQELGVVAKRDLPLGHRRSPDSPSNTCSWAGSNRTPTWDPTGGWLRPGLRMVI